MNDEEKKLMQFAQEARQKHIIELKQHHEIFGHVKKVHSTEFNNSRYVLLNGELICSDNAKNNWKSRYELFRAHLFQKLGKKWFDEEVAKSDEQKHPIMIWYEGICKHMHSLDLSSKNKNSIKHSGYMAAFMILAYDVFCLNNHGYLQDRLIQRLRNTRDFQSARYEIFVFATLIRAGFDLVYEDESDLSIKHVEVVATHRATGQAIAVEARNRQIQGRLGAAQGSDKKFRMSQLISNALKKPYDYPYIIFFDANQPPVQNNPIDSMLYKDIIFRLETIDQLYPPPNAIFITNVPHHYGDNFKSPDPERTFFLKVFANPKFQFDHDILPDIERALAQYGAIQDKL